MINSKPITPADLTLREGIPFSPRYDDFYHSRHGGLAETNHVFLQGNNLPAAWQSENRFTIGETGFGTGLNFLAALSLWKKTTSRGHLDFFSVEKHPVTRDILKTILNSHCPQLDSEDIRLLLAQYPPFVGGWHRLCFPQSRASLYLGFGEAQELFSSLTAQAHAWFLDGFTPAKNEDLWTPDLFQEIRRLSAPSASAATFSAAARVVKGLQSAGFEVRKIPGFAHKRDMTAAHLHGQPAKISSARRAHIIGAGIAGCTIARGLAAQGVKVKLYDTNEGPGLGTSSNPGAVIYPRLTAKPSPEGAFYGAAFLHTARWLQTFYADSFESGGVLQLAHDADRARRQQGFLTAWHLPPEVIQPHKSGIFFPMGGTVNLKDLCTQLIQHPNIEFETREITAPPEAGLTVIAAGINSTAFHNDLTLQPVAGQLLTASLQSLPAAAVTYDGYSARYKNRLIMGSTYHRGTTEIKNPEADRLSILERLNQYVPAVAQNLRERSFDTWQGVRAATPQRTPAFGKLDETTYISTGHGSHGGTSAPYVADLLVAMMTGMSYDHSALKFGQKIIGNGDHP